MHTASNDPTARPSGLRVGYALLGGALAWMAHLIGQTAMTGWACETGQLWPFHAITAATLAMTLHALWIGRRIATDPRAAPAVRAAHLLGRIAVVVNVLSAAVIVAEWLPVIVIHPCAGG